MKALFYGLALIIIFSSCKTNKNIPDATSQLDQKATLIISYSQTSGYSKDVPEYKMELFSNRQMYLTAIKNLDKNGKYLRTLSQKEYENVIKSFTDSDFFKFQNEYTSESLDLPTRYISFNFDKNEKTIKDYEGAPEALKELEYLMQSFLDRVGWEKMSW